MNRTKVAVGKVQGPHTPVTVEEVRGEPHQPLGPIADAHAKEVDPLVGTDLTPEAEDGRRHVMHSLIGPVGRRAVAVFLGRDDYEKVQRGYSHVMANLLMACLPDLVANLGGQIVFTGLFVSSDDAMLNAITFPLEVDGRTRHIVTDGHVFIHLPDERIVASADSEETAAGAVSRIAARSSRDSAAFFKRWLEFARTHNHLRGRAFFADGEPIKRRRRYTWDDILLPEKVKRTVQTHVAGFLSNCDRLRALGVKPRRGLILEGPPGTGKTLLGKVLADTLDASFLWVMPRHVEGPGSFDLILSLARFVAPTVVFLEDLDLFAEDRRAKGWMGLGELMNQLDGAVENEDLVTIATTNRLEAVEEALRNRPGRFDRVLTLDAMDEPCRRRLLAKLLAKAKVAPEDMSYLVSATDGCTGAQLEELTNTLYILAVEHEVAAPGNADGGGNGDATGRGNGLGNADGEGRGDGLARGDPDSDGVARGASTADSPPRPVVTRALIAEAIEEVQADPRRKFGFRVG